MPGMGAEPQSPKWGQAFKNGEGVVQAGRELGPGNVPTQRNSGWSGSSLLSLSLLTQFPHFHASFHTPNPQPPYNKMVSRASAAVPLFADGRASVLLCSCLCPARLCSDVSLLMGFAY